MEVNAVRRIIVAFVVGLLVILTGCSDSQPTPEQSAEEELLSSPTASAPAASPTPVCSTECSNQEVAVTGCDIGQPTTAGKPKQVSTDNVSGIMELRKSDPSICNGIYWARFRPYAETTGAWVVSIDVSGMPREEQKSESTDPTVDGYTEGVYAKPPTDVTYCVTELASGQQTCSKLTLPN